MHGAMVQTATHIFGLALALPRAFAPRIQYRQEGTMSSKATVADHLLIG
jgi:hypothetical protein